GDVEVRPLARGLEPEDAEAVDVGDPVWSAREIPVGAVEAEVLVQTEERDPVALRRDDVEDLPEEERHDREVVAGEAPRREREQEPQETGHEDDEGQDEPRLP